MDSLNNMVRWLPNFLTLLRVFLLWPFMVTFLSKQYGISLCLFMIAAATDGLDGWLARRFKWISHWGGIVDPIADKLLVLIAYFLMMKITVVSSNLFLTVLARELVVLAGAFTYYYWIERYRMMPTKLGKFCTFSHFMFLTVLLLQLTGLTISKGFLEIGVLLIYIVTLISGLQYIWIWSLRAYSTKSLRS